MHPANVFAALKSMVILVDTREQDTPRARKRLHEMGCPYERIALRFGDYSAKCSGIDLRESVSIERKMNLDELCSCYGRGRERFTREFERAKDAGAKLYLLIENADWEKAYNGEYTSRMSSASLVSSLQAWLARYQCQILFCNPQTSGRLIHDILYRELKERLEAMPDENSG